MFVVPGDKVYAGMLVGANTRPGDIELNVCKAKHLTSIRNAAGAEDAMRLHPVRPMTLERAIDFIDDDELVEITPKNIRMRKKILDSTATAPRDKSRMNLTRGRNSSRGFFRWRKCQAMLCCGLAAGEYNESIKKGGNLT